MVVGIYSNHRSFPILTELGPLRVKINSGVNILSSGVRDGEIAKGTGEWGVWVMELCFGPISLIILYK